MKKKILSFLLSSLLLFFCVNTSAAVRQYRSHLENADWHTELGEKNYCKLKQTIPFYGEVTFIHKSGNDMLFELSSLDLLMQNTRVSIIAEPAPWRHDAMSFEIGTYVIEQGHELLKVKSPHASRMFQQLENGMVTTLRYSDLADQRDVIELSVSPLHFRKYLKEFRQCESALLEYDPDFIVDFSVYFATNKTYLTEKAKKYLRYVCKHVNYDKNIKQVKIDAHADNRGRRRFNDQLSEKRGETIKNFLLEQGLEPSMINIIAHGEREPKYDNKTLVGRAKNRHAQIQLLDTPPPAPPPEEEEKVKDDDFVPSDEYNTPVPSFINLEHLINQ